MSQLTPVPSILGPATNNLSTTNLAYVVDCNSAIVALTLPQIVSDGIVISTYRFDAGATGASGAVGGSLTIQAFAGNSIDYSSNPFAISNGASMTLISRGTNWSFGITIAPNGIIYATPGSGTFNASSVDVLGAKKLRIRAWGGGGSGGGLPPSGGGSGGGGGGGYGESLLSINPAFSINYTVGSGGTGVIFTSGNPGGNTTISGAIICTAAGGGGGGINNGGLGGVSSGFDINTNGGNATQFTSTSFGGSGGGSGGTPQQNCVNPGANGVDANYPGGGSTGTAVTSTKNGANGLLILEWW